MVMKPRQSHTNSCLPRIGGSVRKMVVSKGWFWRMFPGPQTHTRTRVKTRFPGPRKAERGYKKRNDGTKNRNEGTFAKTTLLQNRHYPYVQILSTLTVKRKPPCLANFSRYFANFCPILAGVYLILAEANFSQGNAGLLWQIKAGEFTLNRP